MKEIKAKKGEVVLVDDEDFEKLNEYSWCVLNSGYVAGYVNGRKNFLMHRFVLNPPTTKVIDHINGNKLDNRKSNLRICDVQSNIRNSKLYRTNTSGAKGVRKIGGKLPWGAIITVNYKTILIGRFPSLEEAKLARIQKAREVFGEFCNE